jgi:16S rRNA (cytosine1402-N4)-methyltransferase
VKNFIKKGKFEGEIEKDFYGNPLVDMKDISRKAIVADAEELKLNSRSRSAKMRIAEKL